MGIPINTFVALSCNAYGRAIPSWKQHHCKRR